MKKVEHWADSIRVLYTLMVAISETAVCWIKDQTHLIFAGLIHYGSRTLDKLAVRSTIHFKHDFKTWFFLPYLTCISFSKEKKTQVCYCRFKYVLACMIIFVQNSWIRKKCIFELKYFPPEVPNFYGFIRFNIFKNHHGEYIDIL